MEKLSEISLGRKGWILKFGSGFIVLLILIVLFLGLYYIKLPQYADVEIVASEENIFIISSSNLESSEKIKLENDPVITAKLKRIGSDKYELSSNSLSNSMAQNLKANILTNGRILIDRENLFEGLLPFW